ncbi:hypothetical protein [Priestia aryabhattai]|uniref:hypothetical protein n=1 Tax=Priestia aryabhattai TaxID=412384 RepID=UPI003D29A905
MFVNTVIVEQLESDGQLKTLELNTNSSTKEVLVISLAGEYTRERSGPFHFRDPKDEKRYMRELNSCIYEKLGPSKFKKLSQKEYLYSTCWYDVPTERGDLSYYALYLPEYCIPTILSVSDPLDNQREFRRTVFRDEEEKRYIVYLECRSRKGKFNFDLKCQFKSSTRTEFLEFDFDDAFNDNRWVNPKEYERGISQEKSSIIQAFFINNNYIQNAGIVAQDGNFQEVNVTQIKDNT